MQVVGLVGWSGSGKTTLLVALLPLLRARGLRVSTVKHAHDGFDMDRPGKDSHRHREAGAHEVLVAGAGRWALLHEVSGPEPSLDQLLARLDPVDLVLVEGYKSHRFPKVEVHRPSLGKPPIWPAQPDVVAVATDTPGLDCGRIVLRLDAPDQVADWLLGFIGVAPARFAAVRQNG
jgi:molybdopterin-guanine dinucleotide biosynthesis protein B